MKKVLVVLMVLGLSIFALAKDFEDGLQGNWSAIQRAGRIDGEDTFINISPVPMGFVSGDKWIIDDTIYYLDKIEYMFSGAGVSKIHRFKNNYIIIVTQNIITAQVGSDCFLMLFFKNQIRMNAGRKDRISVVVKVSK